CNVPASNDRASSTSTTPKKQHPSRKDGKKWGVYAASQHAANTVNPIRRICDTMTISPNPSKRSIKFHLGDPTTTGILQPCPVTIVAIEQALRSNKYNGYGPAVGIAEAREAVARHFNHAEAPITSEDVVLTNGCSHALQMAIEVLSNPGDNILVPCPGFPLYSTLMRCHGIEDRFYQLDMSEAARINLDHLESLIDRRTRAIIINNPSNPTGFVFSKSQLEAVLQIAHKHCIPIIADEIYGDITYNNARFIPLATLEPKVPIITCDGIGKRYLVPGWRLGWLIVHDHDGVFSEVRKGLVALAQKIVGPCALIQGALPTILAETPSSFFDNIVAIVSQNAAIIDERLCRVPGLHPMKPSGAMYMMVGIDEQLYGNETSFVQGLISEESVFCLPGAVFSAPGWFRVALIYPCEVTVEACDRIVDYCRRRLSSMRRHIQAPMTSSSLLSCGQDADRFSTTASESGWPTSESD
uniref:Tyrosine aminotransferase n=1 Tax=Parascaris univalens TaxID=6257 RepID=A0A914ZNT1_PARUN